MELGSFMPDLWTHLKAKLCNEKCKISFIIVKYHEMSVKIIFINKSIAYAVRDEKKKKKTSPKNILFLTSTF